MRNWQMPVRAIKRVDEENRLRGVLLRVVAIFLALAVGGLFLWALGFSPVAVYALSLIHI